MHSLLGQLMAPGKVGRPSLANITLFIKRASCTNTIVFVSFEKLGFPEAMQIRRTS